MAVKLGGDLGGGKSNNYADNSEINVTPFVDIMLVLLIIFMIAAPLATVNVKVDLPPSNADPAPNPPNLTFISIQKTGQIYVMDDEVTYLTLISRIEVRTKGNREERLFLRADQEVAYREVMRVMNTLQDAGYYKIALVAEEVVD
jgi:TonB system transport protein ExbD (group 1)